MSLLQTLKLASASPSRPSYQSIVAETMRASRFFDRRPSDSRHDCAQSPRRGCVGIQPQATRTKGAATSITRHLLGISDAMRPPLRMHGIGD